MESRTEGHVVSLAKERNKLDLRKHSFSQVTLNEWSKLLTRVNTSNANTFLAELTVTNISEGRIQWNKL